jgi:NADH dehydrogenase FAD-containing subunit
MLAETRPDDATAVVEARRSERKRVVIIGGGFAGIAAAHALRHADAEVLLIDRRNHHIFQPLLYQVATAVLSPAEIAAPIRQLEAKQRNVSVVLAEVTGLDVASRAQRCSGPRVSPHRRFLDTKTDCAGRALVDPFLKVVDAPGVFVVGDAASAMRNGHAVPGVAQAAIQEGRYVGRLIAKELRGRKIKRPFRYFDKGNVAVVGKKYAVLERGWFRTIGFLTWLVWAFVHILSLPQLQNRLRVQRQWLWTYFTGQRSSRLISETHEPRH